jgi:tRNA(adenine34) deaminase
MCDVSADLVDVRLRTPRKQLPRLRDPLEAFVICDVVSLRYHRGMSATMYMRRCLELAEIAARAGDTAVGALIVCGDEVVGEGAERSRATLDPSAHAEVEAIRQACRYLETLDLRGCSLYSTVEPCVLCGYAIRRTGIAQVVYGVPAGQAGACTSSYAILADRDLEGWPQVPEVTGGVLADECLAALRRT